MSDVVLAVDLGGTNMRMAAVSAEGSILNRAKCETPAKVTPDQLIDLTLSLISECTQGLPADAKISGLGFATPAPASQQSKGVLSKLPNLPSLNGMDLRGRLQRHVPFDICLENDATAAAIGEHWLGASKALDNVIHVTLGTGVGGGLILNGEPYRGIDGTAGEIGHICVEPEGHPCGCGSRGCLEQYASATAVERMAHSRGLPVRASHDVYHAAKSGDPIAQEIFNAVGYYLGIALAGLINTLNPEMVVIGGGLAAGWDAARTAALEQLAARTFEEPLARVKIVTSELGDDAGILGAAWASLSRK
jgi:glucokinase